jgi:MoaE-MoaD fusion protein
MQVTVLFFATLKELAQQKKITWSSPVEQTTVAGLRHELMLKFPHMEENLRVALCAINEEFAFDPEPITDGDEVAFFPPVSGGSGVQPELFLLPYEPFDHDAIIQAISTPEAGAVVVFSGLVRGVTHKQGHLPNTERLEYEAYEPMAKAKMRQVADEIRAKFSGVIGIALVQRLGVLDVGDNTVLVACSSAHRDSGCFEGARYGIDRLKEIIPVWKKEVSPEGSQWIEGDYTPTTDDKA